MQCFNRCTTGTQRTRAVREATPGCFRHHVAGHLPVAQATAGAWQLAVPRVGCQGPWGDTACVVHSTALPEPDGTARHGAVGHGPSQRIHWDRSVPYAAGTIRCSLLPSTRTRVQGRARRTALDVQGTDCMVLMASFRICRRPGQTRSARPTPPDCPGPIRAGCGPGRHD